MYVLLLDPWCCLVRAAKAAVMYADANVAVLYVHVNLIVLSNTYVLSQQFLCMPKNLLHLYAHLQIQTFSSSWCQLKVFTIWTIFFAGEYFGTLMETGQ